MLMMCMERWTSVRIAILKYLQVFYEQVLLCWEIDSVKVSSLDSSTRVSLLLIRHRRRVVDNLNRRLALVFLL